MKFASSYEPGEFESDIYAAWEASGVFNPKLTTKPVDDDGDGRWVYMPLADDNNYYLPKMDYVVLVPYANSVLAFGNNKKIYQSRDQGITWKTTAAIQYPDGFNATSSYKVAVDNEDVLWLMDTVSGQTWKGRLTEQADIAVGFALIKSEK